MLNHPRLLVIGGPCVGKGSVLSAVLGVSPDQLKSGVHVWQLDTKYYTAEIEVHLHRVGDLDPAHVGAYEAVLLVFDVKESTSLAAVQVWTKAAELDGAEIRLCVANKLDLLDEGKGVVRDSWLDDGAQWCVDEQFEYVEVSATDPAVNAALEDNDDYGLRRVKAALEAHAW